MAGSSVAVEASEPIEVVSEGEQQILVHRVKAEPPAPVDLLIVGDAATAYAAANAAWGRCRSIGVVLPTVAAQNSQQSPPVEFHVAFRELLRRTGREAPRYPSEDNAPETRPDSPLDLKAVWQQVTAASEEQTEGEILENLHRSGISVARGRVAVVGRNSLEVGDRLLRFRRAIVALKWKTDTSQIAGCPPDGCLTEETISRMQRLPHRLAVVGTGGSACQWAQLFQRLGCEVHLVGLTSRLLPEEDPQIASLVAARFERDQLRVHLGCSSLALEKMGNRKALLLARGEQREKLLIDELLVCEPKQPGLDLGLDRAGIPAGARQFQVNAYLQSANPAVLLIGQRSDWRATGRLALKQAAEIAGHNASSRFPWRWLYRRYDPQLVPRCLWLDPEVVEIGLSAADAHRRPERFEVYRLEIPQPQAPAGYLSVAVESITGQVAGITAVGPRAGELAAPLQTLMAGRLPLETLAAVIPACGSSLQWVRELACRRWDDRRRRLGNDWGDWPQQALARLRAWLESRR
jgi:pyruvate/2-oxoglutarate dehydrogenase complex dihydrolipoamide dehydrogenase (E3) component